jgi:hypothetical protein
MSRLIFEFSNVLFDWLPRLAMSANNTDWTTVTGKHIISQNNKVELCYYLYKKYYILFKFGFSFDAIIEKKSRKDYLKSEVPALICM